MSDEDIEHGAIKCPKCQHGLSMHRGNHGDFDDCTGVPRRGWRCRCETSRESIIWAHADALRVENTTLREALAPFAAMHREGTDPTELASVRGIASDMTTITSGDFAKAFAALQEARHE